MTYSFGTAAFFLFIYLLIFNMGSGNAFFSQLFWLGTSLHGWLIMLGLVLLAGVIGYGLYQVSLTYLPASVANLIATLEPAFTAFLAYMFLGERLTVTQLTGSLMIMLGVLLLRVSGLHSNNQQPAATTAC